MWAEFGSRLRVDDAGITFHFIFLSITPKHSLGWVWKNTSRHKILWYCEGWDEFHSAYTMTLSITISVQRFLIVDNWKPIPHTSWVSFSKSSNLCSWMDDRLSLVVDDIRLPSDGQGEKTSPVSSDSIRSTWEWDEKSLLKSQKFTFLFRSTLSLYFRSSCWACDRSVIILIILISTTQIVVLDVWVYCRQWRALLQSINDDYARTWKCACISFVVVDFLSSSRCFTTR